VRSDCPFPDTLVLLAVGASDPEAAAHVRDCPPCRDELAALRDVAVAVRTNAAAAPRPETHCLDDDGVAAAAGGAGEPPDSTTLAHLAACARCSGRVAAVARLLSEPGLAAELRRLETASGGPIRRRPVLAASFAAASLAAAAVLAVVFVPPRTATVAPGAGDPDGAVHRESAITTTVAPRIVGPAAQAAAGDSLRWTAVPHADRYEVKVFDRDAQLVWNPWTTDTALAIPEHLVRPDAATYLWKVEARTGWDRWVSSEWADLTIDGSNRPR
jgi:hypothetical protein